MYTLFSRLAKLYQYHKQTEIYNAYIYKINKVIQKNIIKQTVSNLMFESETLITAYIKWYFAFHYIKQTFSTKSK